MKSVTKYSLLILINVVAITCQTIQTDDEIKRIHAAIVKLKKEMEPQPPTPAECQKYCNKPCNNFFYDFPLKLNASAGLGQLVTGTDRCKHANKVCDCPILKDSDDEVDCKIYCNKNCVSLYPIEERDRCRKAVARCVCPLNPHHYNTPTKDSEVEHELDQIPSKAKCDIVCPKGCRRARGSVDEACQEIRSKCNCPIYDNTLYLLVFAAIVLIPAFIMAWCIWRRFFRNTCCPTNPSQLHGSALYQPVTPNIIPPHSLPLTSPRFGAQVPYPNPNPSAPLPLAEDDPPPYASIMLKA